MPTVYENFGVRFSYPEDWSLIDEEEQQWPRRVSVQSPGSGFWELQVYPPDIGPAGLVEQALEAFQEEYDDVESEEISANVGETEVVGCDLNFFCGNFLVACQVRGFAHDGHTLLLICQAESREFDERADEFEAISRSLFSPEDSAKLD